MMMVLTKWSVITTVVCFFGRFSSKTLTRLCDQIENKPMAGMLVFGEGQAARSLALAGTGMKLPVLWAKGGIAKIHGIGREVINVSFSFLSTQNKVINLKSACLTSGK